MGLSDGHCIAVGPRANGLLSRPHAQVNLSLSSHGSAWIARVSGHERSVAASGCGAVSGNASVSRSLQVGSHLSTSALPREPNGDDPRWPSQTELTLQLSWQAEAATRGRQHCIAVTAAVNRGQRTASSIWGMLGTNLWWYLSQLEWRKAGDH
jgi:hypothetical protein